MIDGMNTATFISNKVSESGARQHLYRMDPPIKDYDGGEHEHVSAVYVLGAPETYIFPADAEGEITDWGELEGSYKGGTDHGEALRGAGYTVAS